MNEDIIGEAGGIPGLVRIIADHQGHYRRVEIDDLVFKETDKDLVSALFVAALNDLTKKMQERAMEKIRNSPRPTGSFLDQLLGGKAKVFELPPIQLDVDVDNDEDKG